MRALVSGRFVVKCQRSLNTCAIGEADDLLSELISGAVAPNKMLNDLVLRQKRLLWIFRFLLTPYQSSFSLTGIGTLSLFTTSFGTSFPSPFAHCSQIVFPYSHQSKSHDKLSQESNLRGSVHLGFYCLARSKTFCNRTSTIRST